MGRAYFKFLCSSRTPKVNRFYAREQEKSTDVDNGTLIVFSFPVYALLDPVSTLLMVNPFVANQFELLPKMFHELFLVNTPIGDSVMAEEVCIEVDGIVASPLEIKLGVIRFKS